MIPPRLKIRHIELDGCALLAPMAGITDSPVRRAAKKMGAALVCTEMVSAAGLLAAKGEARHYFFHLLSAHPEERPLAVQLFGADPKLMARAAGLVAAIDADLIDLNMGCPVPKVVRRGEGAALMKDPARVKAMVAEVRKAVGNVPLTVKMRSGFSPDKINAPEISRISEGEGADAVIIHARTAVQGFAGKADWSVIKACRQAVKIPVIGNGDVKTRADAERMFEETGCQGVMIGRAALGNPWLFRQLKNPDAPSPNTAERMQVLLDMFELAAEIYDDFDATAFMRRQLVWFSKGVPRGIELRRNLAKIKTKKQAWEAARKLFSP